MFSNLISKIKEFIQVELDILSIRFNRLIRSIADIVVNNRGIAVLSLLLAVSIASKFI